VRSSSQAERPTRSVDAERSAPDTQAEWLHRQAEWLQTALHDFAQPLTALECGLFLSTLDADQDARALRQTVDAAMVQCQRMLVCFRELQALSTATRSNTNR